MNLKNYKIAEREASVRTIESFLERKNVILQGLTQREQVTFLKACLKLQDITAYADENYDEYIEGLEDNGLE